MFLFVHLKVPDTLEAKEPYLARFHLQEEVLFQDTHKLFGDAGLSDNKYCCRYHYRKDVFEPYPRFWTEKLKRQIRKRDAYLCMMCDRHQDEFSCSHSVHHIDGDKNNCDPNNLISLCNRHHRIVEGSGKAQTFWMPKFQKMLSKLYGYKYE